MGSPTEFLTLNFSEFPNAAAASFWWDIVETGDIPPQYYLSARAAKGFLKRGKGGGRMPLELAQALEELVKE